MDAQFWDDRYGSRDQLFSGAPNGVLVTEITDFPPGQALDVGCGEGGDALWLARQGWQVTGVDISEVALRRAAEAATDVADRVSWARADLAVTAPPADAFDLVSAQYFPLPRHPDHTALRGLLNAVAPGGTLLFVGHDLAGLPDQPMSGVHPADYYRPADIAPLLGPDWTVEINETRPRTVPAPAGTGHTHDTVLRARRRR
ncbi:methyltransferase domain-containing protein [Streptomyces sp. NPDC018045]|uniref:methyltransferase domain-containing protein n=1 Tax=Streptomyces sp. NPDC018045 TaxID=3365037 RepID=UPI0037B9E4CA